MANGLLLDPVTDNDMPRSSQFCIVARDGMQYTQSREANQGHAKKPENKELLAGSAIDRC